MALSNYLNTGNVYVARWLRLIRQPRACRDVHVVFGDVQVLDVALAGEPLENVEEGDEPSEAPGEERSVLERGA